MAFEADGAAAGTGVVATLSDARNAPSGDAGPWSALAAVASHAGANFKAQAALLAASCEEADPAHECARDRVLTAAAGALEAANVVGWEATAEAPGTATASLPLLPLVLDRLPGNVSDATLARVLHAVIRGMELRAAGTGIPPRLCADLVQRLPLPREGAARPALLTWANDDGLAPLVGSLAAELAPFDPDLWWTLLQAAVRHAAWAGAGAMALRFPDRALGRRMALHAAHVAFAGRHLRACTDLVQRAGIEDLFPPDAHLLRNLILCRLAAAGRWREARRLAGADHSARARLASLVTARANGGPSAVADAARAACAVGPAWHRAAPLPAPESARGVIVVDSTETFRAARARVDALREGATLPPPAPPVVGIDCEWRPSAAGDRSSPACVVQVAGPAWALVVDLLAGDIALRAELAAWLGGLLRDRGVLKVGLGLAEDVHRLALACGPACARAHRCLDVRTALARARAAAARRAPPDEATSAWRAVALAPDPFSASAGGGLQAMVETVLGRAMDKSCQTSAWHRRPLTAAQVAYAALDAQILLRLLDAMEHAVAAPKPQVGAAPPPPYAWAEAATEDVGGGEAGVADQAVERERPRARNGRPLPKGAQTAAAAGADASPDAGELEPLGEDDVLRAVAQLGIEVRLHRFPEPQLRAKHVANAMGVDVRAVAKSLGFLVGDRPIVVVCSGPDRVHRGRLARLMGVRRKAVSFAPPSRCVELFGYAPGSMPPLGHRETVPVVVDSDLSQRDVILCGGGTSQTVARMRVKHLLSAPQTRVADVADGSQSRVSTPTTPASPASGADASPAEPEDRGEGSPATSSAQREPSPGGRGRTRGAWLEALGDSARLPSLHGSHTVGPPSPAEPSTPQNDLPSGAGATPPGDSERTGDSGAGQRPETGMETSAQEREEEVEEEKEDEEAAFLVRPMRKRLLKWLRVMGADVQFSTTPAASEVLREAKAQGRVVVTADHHIARQAWEVPVFVTAATGDRDMFLETIRHFGIAFDERRFMSRCAQCSGKHFSLLDVEEVRARNAAPKSVMQSYSRFFECADCKKVYWVGEKYREAFDAFQKMASEKRRCRASARGRRTIAPSAHFPPRMEAEAIPLRLASTDGGEHSSRYSTDHLFKSGNSNVYSSEKKDEVCVVAQPVNTMQLFYAEEISMHNPPSHFDSPVRTAMAFVSDALPASEDFRAYKRDFSREEYEELVRRAEWSAGKARPVAFFELSGPDDVTRVKIDPPVRGRYLTIKFLSVHGGNVDCANVTLRGRLVSAFQHDRATPLRGPPRARSKLRGVGLKVFASMLSAISPEDTAMARFTLTRVNNQLRDMQPGSMLADWAPPPMEEEEEAAVDRSSVAVSSAQSGYGGEKSLDDGDGPSAWKCKPGTDAAQWSARLRGPASVQRVRLVFADRQAPASVMVSLARDDAGGGAQGDAAALSYVPVAARTVTQPEEVCVTIPSRARFSARAVRLDLSGHHSSNRERMVSVSSIQLLQPAQDRATSPRECLATIERWAARVLCASRDPQARAEAMQVLMRLSITSGTLASQLQLADALLSPAGGDEHALPECVGHDAAAYLAFLSRDALERERELLAHEIQFTPRRGRAPVEGACFDELAASGGVNILDGGETVRSVSGNNQHCLVNVGFSSATCSWAAWEFKLQEDTSSQTTCFGAAIKPVQNSSYERSKELWMYRAYSGQLYSLGSTRSLRKRKVHKGNTIRFELFWSDCTIRASVEGEDQGVVFEVEEGQTVYPAVAFYGSNRSVSLQSVESDRESSVMPLPELPLLSHKVGFGEMGLGGKLGYGPKPGDADPGVRLGGQPMRGAICLHPPPGSLGDSPLDEETDLPPDEACAFAEYSLAGEFAQFTARCAINGSADEAMLAEHSVRAYFEVWVDGRRRWRSPAHRHAEVESTVTLNVNRARRLRLVTRCAEKNFSAHCVWVGASLVPATLYSHWFDRMLGDTPGAVHGLVDTLPAPDAALGGQQPAMAFVGRMLGLSSALAATHTRITRDAGTQFAPDSSDDIWAPFPLESAHSLEASPRTLSVLVRLLEKLAKRAREGDGASPADDALCASLELVGANLRRIAVSCIDPVDAGFDSGPRLASTAEHKEPEPEPAADAEMAAPGVPESAAAAGQQHRPSEVFSRERLYRILQDMVQTGGGAGRGISSRARALAGEVLHVGAPLLVPDPAARASALRDAAVRSRVVELQLRWPVVAATSDEDRRLERAALTVQGAALRHGWRATVLGSWMALLYVVVDVPEEGRKDGSAVRFLESEMPEAMAQAGIEGFHASTGLAEPLVSVRVEHDHAVDRGARLTREPGVGCVRLFVEEDTSFDAVCEGIRGFTKLCQQDKQE